MSSLRVRVKHCGERFCPKSDGHVPQKFLPPFRSSLWQALYRPSCSSLPLLWSLSHSVSTGSHSGVSTWTMATHALFETASGYAVFEVKLHDAVGSLEKAVQSSIDDYSKFSKMVSLVSFAPFQNAAHALENMNDISEGAFCFSSYMERRSFGCRHHQPLPPVRPGAQPLQAQEGLHRRSCGEPTHCARDQE